MILDKLKTFGTQRLFVVVVAEHFVYLSRQTQLIGHSGNNTLEIVKQMRLAGDNRNTIRHRQTNRSGSSIDTVIGVVLIREDGKLCRTQKIRKDLLR